MRNDNSASVNRHERTKKKAATDCSGQPFLLLYRSGYFFFFGMWMALASTSRAASMMLSAIVG
jgi:hypothetical protein